MIALGVDVGTSGVRVAALGADGAALGSWSATFDARASARRDPAHWWETLEKALAAALQTLRREKIGALAVDGTSGTLLAVDADGRPVGAPLMYDDAVDEAAVLERIAVHLPARSAAGGATSGLAKAIVLARRSPARVIHQADWIRGRLDGDFAASDVNNALKTGYDPVADEWPDWIERAGMEPRLLPRVEPPGTPLGRVAPELAARLGLPETLRLVSGTTDGCASFLATGASRPGEAVTALGSTLVLKVLADEPLFDPAIGLYSHRVGEVWLAGGASNSGGRVLLQHFDERTLETLSAAIDAEGDSGLDYYPLPASGERFPHNDPTLEPRIAPRPDDDVRFLHGLFEGMARIEALGYARLAEIGAPALRSVRSVGGGAGNPAWRRIRERVLGVPLVEAVSSEAAVGTAGLALGALRRSGEAGGGSPC